MSKSLILKLVRSMDQHAATMPRWLPVKPLRGSFSALERLRAGIYDGAVDFEAQSRGVCPKGSVTEQCGFRQHDHQPWPAFWTRCEDARLVGSMWHWRDPGDLLCREGVYGLVERRRLGEDRFTAQWLPGKPERLKGAWTSIASNWGDGRNYFHWLLDSLTRLQIREGLPEPTRILLPRSTAPYIGETLELLGLAEQAECPDGHCLQPERYYFCSPTAMTGVWNPAGFDWLRKSFASHYSEAGSSGPIFLTRRATNRIPTAIKEVESLFRQAGFRIVDPGQMRVSEQIGLASGATALAGIHGAAMTNLMWAIPGTPVLEIFGSEYLNACYEQISLQGGLPYTYTVLERSNALETMRSWASANSSTI